MNKEGTLQVITHSPKEVKIELKLLIVSKLMQQFACPLCNKEDYSNMYNDKATINSFLKLLLLTRQRIIL